MKKKLSNAKREELIETLKARFERHKERHLDMKWSEVETRLDARPEKLGPLHEMESSGGEPDAVGRDRETGEIVFFDCAAETPKGRTSVCYDRAGLESRREHQPKTTAKDLAEAMGIGLLNEAQYRELQALGNFDTKTSSWLETPEDIRRLGGALYGERRYGRVFVGHNGAQSYYGARGFRGWLRV